MITSDQDAAMSLHLLRSSALAPGFHMTLQRMNTGRSKSSNTSTGTRDFYMAWYRSGRNSDITAFLFCSASRIMNEFAGKYLINWILLSWFPMCKQNRTNRQKYGKTEFIFQISEFHVCTSQQFSPSKLEKINIGKPFCFCWRGLVVIWMDGFPEICYFEFRFGKSLFVVGRKMSPWNLSQYLQPFTSNRESDIFDDIPNKNKKCQ